MIKGTENLVIGDLISRRIPFFVPKYQRNYAWDLDEVSDFTGDITQLFQKRAAGATNVQKHFFGGIVSIDVLMPGSMHGRSFELVDGQQRLATFLIAVSLIIKTLKEVAAEANAIGDTVTESSATSQATLAESNYVKYREEVSGTIEEKLRVTLSRADALFYAQLLDGDISNATRDSHNKLVAARTQIREKLFNALALAGALTPGQKLANILLLQRCLLEDCHVLHVYSDDRQEAYRLFRILNDRGRPISDGDKLRSHTLEMLEGDEQLQSVVEQQWDDILAMGESEVDSFLQVYFTAQAGEKAPKRELFDKFVGTLLSPPVTAQSRTYVATRVQLIHTARSYYLALVEGEWPYAASMVSTWKRDRLTRLILVLRHNLCLPLLLAIRETSSEATFSEAVLLLERFAFRYVNVVAAHHNPPNTVYANSVRTLRSSPPTFTVADLHADLGTITQRYASDNVFESSLFNKLDYRQSTQRRLIKHFLTTIEDYRAWLQAGATGALTADETRVLDVAMNTIEHIYPQNAQAANVDVALEAEKHSLPNLTFWGAGDNQAAGNLPFPQKVPAYSASSIGLNRDLAALPAFAIAQLNARRSQFLDSAKKIFSI